MPQGILVLGGKGYMGQRLLAAYPGAAVSDVDIADAPALAAELDRDRPAVVINCAGKTGRPNIDWCEDHKLETLRSNVTGALVVLETCLERGTYLVHLSSGCIYEGDNGGVGFGENDHPQLRRQLLFADQGSGSTRWCLRDFPVLSLRLAYAGFSTVRCRSVT